MIAVIANELRLLLRDPGAALWLVVGPVLVMTVISAARYDSGKRAPLLLPIVDDDQGPVARAFVELLARRADPVEMTRAEAESVVRDQGKAAAAIVFPQGMSRRYLQGRPSEVLLLTDPAEPVGLNRLKVALLLMSRDAADLADPVGVPRLEIVEQNLTGDQVSRKSHEQNVPGFAIMFTLLGVVYGTASALHRETHAGTFGRLLVAPLGFGRILYAKLILRSLIGAAQLLVLLAWGRLVFGVSLGSSVAALLALVLATGVASVGLGAVVASLGRSDQQVLPLVLAIVLPVSAVAGLWWPLHREPGWMQAVAGFAFPTWAMSGIVDLVLRDRGLAAVAGRSGLVLAQGLALLVAGVWLFRLRVARR